MRRALVTGASGFIGRQLARRLLSDGWQVDLLVRPSTAIADDLSAARVHRLDGGTEAVVKAVRQAQPDVVFHLASLYLAEHKADDVERLIASNLLFTVQLAEAMTASLPEHCRRLISAGTSWQHYHSAGYRPVNLYAATKQAGEDLLAYYTDACSLSLIVLKLFDTFGAGDVRRKLVQLLVDASVSGEQLGVSPGQQVIDICHVDDVVDAFVIAAERLLLSSAQLDEHYLISGERLTVRELVPIVEQATGRPLDVVFGARPYRTREVMEPVLPMPGQILPGWSPRRRLVEALSTLMPS